MGAESSFVASQVEDVHLLAEAVNKRLRIVHRIEIKIDVPKISIGRTSVARHHALWDVSVL